MVALKATGTSGSMGELSAYRDYGVAQAFDCVDFGFPARTRRIAPTCSSLFERALDICLSMPADAVLVECGGDVLGANVPRFLKCLMADVPCQGYSGCVRCACGLGWQARAKDMGISVDLVTGLCTDTPTLRQRTEMLCGIPAINMASAREDAPF